MAIIFLAILTSIIGVLRLVIAVFCILKLNQNKNFAAFTSGHGVTGSVVE